jgi:hypothetical protein
MGAIPRDCTERTVATTTRAGVWSLEGTTRSPATPPAIDGVVWIRPIRGPTGLMEGHFDRPIHPKNCAMLGIHTAPTCRRACGVAIRGGAYCERPSGGMAGHRHSLADLLRYPVRARVYAGSPVAGQTPNPGTDETLGT